MNIEESAESTVALPKLNSTNGETLVAQIERHFREAIQRGAIQSGTRLPTCSELGHSLGVSPQTVHRAFTSLARNNLVYRRRSLGTFVGFSRSPSVSPASTAQRARMAAPPISMVIRPMPPVDEISRVVTLRLNDYLNGLFEGFNAWKCRFEIAHLEPDQPDLDLVKALVETGQTRGFVTMSMHPSAIEYLVQQAIPLVNISQDLTAQGVPSIIADRVKGYREAWEFAGQLGHRHATFVRIQQTRSEERLRECSAGRELANVVCHLDQPAEVPSEVDLPAVWTAIERRFGVFKNDGSWPTLLFAQTDLLAMHLIQAFQKHDIRVPRDVSVIGFDDISITSLSHPPLTTLHVPRFKMGLAAAQHLLQILAKRSVGMANLTLLPVHLVPRESCGAPRAGSADTQAMTAHEKTSVHDDRVSSKKNMG